MRFATLALIALAGTVLEGCSELPGQGFVTTSLGGTVVDMVSDSRPAAEQDASTPPPRVDGQRPTLPDICTSSAQDRADDAKAQGFGEATVKQVFDATLAECRNWAERH